MVSLVLASHRPSAVTQADHPSVTALQDLEHVVTSGTPTVPPPFLVTAPTLPTTTTPPSWPLPRLPAASTPSKFLESMTVAFARSGLPSRMSSLPLLPMVPSLALLPPSPPLVDPLE